MKRRDGILLRADTPTGKEDSSELRAHFAPGLVVLVHWRVFGMHEQSGQVFTMTDAVARRFVEEYRARRGE